MYLWINKTAGDSKESLFRPWKEPVDGCAIDEARKVSTAVPKIVTHRAHAQSKMQTSCAVLVEPAPYSVFTDGHIGSVLSPQCRLCFGPDVINHPILLLFREERDKATGCEDIVDQFEET